MNHLNNLTDVEKFISTTDLTSLKRDELLELKFPPFGLPIERDMCFESTPIKELM